MITTTLEKYLAIAVAVLIGSGALAGWWALHNHKLEQIGYQQCAKQDAVVVEKAKADNTVAETTQVAADKTAQEKLDAAHQNPVTADSLPRLPDSGVQQSAGAASCPSPLRNPGAVARQNLPAVGVRTEPPAAVVQPDWHAIERSDVQSAKDADDEVTYWKGLLVAQYKLCGGKAPAQL